LKESDIVSIRSGGGGEWGDPSQRDPELVLNDVKDGLITHKQAYDIYKVAIEPKTFEIDWEATERMRAKARSGVT